MARRHQGAQETRWRREYQVSLGLVLMWAGSIGLSLNASLLEGRLDLVSLLVRTLIVLLIWCLSIYSIRSRGGVSAALGKLQALSADEFAAWVAGRLREAGFTKVTSTGGKRGVDFIAEAPDEVAVVQCRQYGAWQVEGPAVRDLYTAMCDLRADHAYLATTGQLAQSARLWAADKPVTMWDAQVLAQLASEALPAHGLRASSPRRSDPPAIGRASVQRARVQADVALAAGQGQSR
jgi:HJR/Mrr/RecB family endonuclease